MLVEDIGDAVPRQRLSVAIYKNVAPIRAARHATQPVQGGGGLTP